MSGADVGWGSRIRTRVLAFKARSPATRRSPNLNPCSILLSRLVRATGFEPAFAELRSLLEESTGLETRFSSDPLKQPFGASATVCLYPMTCVAFSADPLTTFEGRVYLLRHARMIQIGPFPRTRTGTSRGHCVLSAARMPFRQEGERKEGGSK
jgi:hypothetical protein